MGVNFEYALVEINGKEVLVNKEDLAKAAESLRKRVDEIIEKVAQVKDDVKQNGFALETPPGMSPLVLGSASDFSDWASRQMGLDFKLEKEIDGLPDPFKTGLSGLSRTELVLYSASLIYTGVKVKKNPGLYGELLIGFQIPDDMMQDFPLALRQVVIKVDNYPS